jgi:Zn-dependent peptidase ImmA (M78 family)
MIPDKTGRFSLRPFWEVAELELMCEETITGLLRQRYGFDRVPVPTEAITVLIERDAGDLDFATDLSDDFYDTFGVTLFSPGRKPTVKIARELWEQRSRSNRLRMTLAHEYGHVLLHTWLYDEYAKSQDPQRCYWKNLHPTRRVIDWLEWQAGYAGAALLMPESFVKRATAAYFAERRDRPPVGKDSADASALAQRISLTFDVSVEAAKVRLAKRNCLTD